MLRIIEINLWPLSLGNCGLDLSEIATSKVTIVWKVKEKQRRAVECHFYTNN